MPNRGQFTPYPLVLLITETIVYLVLQEETCCGTGVYCMFKRLCQAQSYGKGSQTFFIINCL